MLALLRERPFPKMGRPQSWLRRRRDAAMRETGPHIFLFFGGFVGSCARVLAAWKSARSPRPRTRPRVVVARDGRGALPFSCTLLLLPLLLCEGTPTAADSIGVTLIAETFLLVFFLPEMAVLSGDEPRYRELARVVVRF